MPLSFVANERGLPDAPFFDAAALYVAVLREPRARYLSQYLHLKLYGEAYLLVRATRVPTAVREHARHPGR